jgi:hypothetical protein
MSDNVSPVPNLPEVDRKSTEKDPVKIATPDLILFDQDSLTVEYMTDLIFEDLGGQELINIIRNDIINGVNVSYNLIANRRSISQQYNSSNILNIPGSIEEYFSNFSINLADHIPPTGTGPIPYRVGQLNSFGCSGYPVLKNTDDSVVGCYEDIRQAQAAVEALSGLRPFVYIDEETGELVVDVISLGTNDQVDVEVLSEGEVLDATIY